MTDIPRRLTVEELRTTHRHLAGRLDIFLNGELVHDVVSYDVDAGTVERLARDKGGDLIIDETGKNVVHDVTHGKVAVQLRHERQCHA